uniref:Phosphorylase b kinase regulatory subunit n=1 Tax=Macrostomum lignano TaxID=282301 RepID=A0A1I8FIG8_9PLAT
IRPSHARPSGRCLAIGHDLLQQFGRACQTSCGTAVSKNLLQLLSDPALLWPRRLTAASADWPPHRFRCLSQEQGARMPRDVRELSDIGKVAQLATLSEIWLVTIAGPLFGAVQSERKVTNSFDHLKVLSGKCFNVIMIEVCLRASKSTEGSTYSRK